MKTETHEMEASDDNVPLAILAARQRPQSEIYKSSNTGSAARRPSVPTITTAPVSTSANGKRRSRTQQAQAAVTAGFVVNMDAPETPSSPTDDDMIAYFPQPSLFHNYLRALHPFDPTTSPIPGEDITLSTVAIKPGDLILVHCIHANGWADGTVLNNGTRGWLPTNYCEAYDHSYLRNLLNAMTQFWDLLGGSEDANLSTFVRQDYIRGLIAGVRYLLERADCLHRDASTVKQHAGVRRMRKGLLADLSALVQIAKRLQEMISEPFAGEVIHVLLDDLISKAFKVVTRAVSFTDVWAQETSAGRYEYQHSANRRATSASAPLSVGSPLAIDTRVSEQKEVALPIDSAKHLPGQTDNIDSAAGAEDETRSGEKHPPRLSMVFTPPDGVVAHRLSLVTQDNSDNHALSGLLASEQLAKEHDICISHIGAFIGHHLHARPASELVATTERLVKACRKMLAIVDEVYAHDPQTSLPVQKVKEDFELKLEELARSTKAVFRFSDLPDEDVVMLPGQTQHLISVGTSLIRASGECVVKTRQLIEQIGDFEMKSQRLSRRPSRDTMARVDSMPSGPVRNSKLFSFMRQSMDMRSMPPAPTAPSHRPTDVAEEQDDEVASSVGMADTINTRVPMHAETRKMSVTQPRGQRSMIRSSVTSTHHAADTLRSPRSVRSNSVSPARKNSMGISIAGSTETFISSARDSGTTAVSMISTRATTPEHPRSPNRAMMASFASVSSMRSLVTDDSVDVETQLLQKSYAHELTFNKEGQVTGGSLPALVEQLTTPDVAPDPQYVTAFFLTFRKFAEPRELAQALILRFDYIGDSRTTGTPVRLRIYNVFKGWLETYWNPEADKDALGEIRFFALHKLKPVLPAAGDRLSDLTRRVTDGYSNGTIRGPLVSGVGKSSMSVAGGTAEVTVPQPITTVRQLNALRLATGGGAKCNIVDFDAVEIARQITLLMMKTYCEIRPEELLSMDWGRPNTKKAKNVRQMCLLNTDLANLVGDSILGPEDARRRANVIKQWAKIATACLELNNYDSVMSIMSSINSSVVKRLKKTWDVVSKNTKARLEELDKVVDMSKNYSTLRKRLETPTAPCLPFLGVYLTDLTFVLAGNPKRRQLPGSANENGEEISIINFDMYWRIAKIISHLQRFQVPYRLQLVPEMHVWIEFHLRRMRQGHDDMTTTLHHRSLTIEPRDTGKQTGVHSRPESGIEPARPKTATSQHEDRFDVFRKNTFSLRQMPSMPAMMVDYHRRAGAQQPEQ